jgi:valyl-tRNA synthetase
VGARFEPFRLVVTDMRRLRAEQKIEPAKAVEFAIVCSTDMRSVIEENVAWMKRLTNASEITLIDALPADWPLVASGSTSVALNVAGAVDVEAEREKAKKELVDLEKYIASTEQKLLNTEFTAKAPVKVVDDMKHKLDEAKKKAEILTKKANAG